MKTRDFNHTLDSIRETVAFHIKTWVNAAGIILLVLLTIQPASTTMAQSGETTAFVSVNVIPMDRERVLEAQTVIVRGDRIIAIGPADEVSIPPGAQLIEGNGGYLIPGLTDTHFHILDNQDSLILAIANGVTTVRDPNADYIGTGQAILEARDQIAAGERLGPTITAAKSLLGASERVQVLLDNVDRVVGPWFAGDWGSVISISSDPTSGRALVYQAYEDGYDIIKVNWYLNRETFDSIVAAADELGMPVLAHVPAGVGIEHAIRSGVEIQHNGNLLAFFAKEYVRQPGPNYLDAFDLSEADQKLPELVTLMKENDVAFTPTMVVDVTAFELFDNLPDWSQAAIFKRPGYRYVPPSYMSQWTNAAGGEFGVVARGRGVSSVAEIVPPPAAREEILSLHLRQLKALVDAGVPVMTGTDASAVGVNWGFAIHEELELFVKAGQTPYQALDASTRIPAEVMGGPHEWGTIEEGKRADMVLLGANPLANIGNTREIVGVMVRGQWLPHEKLQGMLDDLAARYEVPKKIQFAAASVLALGALAYAAFVGRGVLNGRRRFGWGFSWGKALRIYLLVVILAAWWGFWHTDIVLSHILGTLPDNAVTVRMLVPWPAAFIWISSAITLWLLAWIAVTFAPKAPASKTRYPFPEQGLSVEGDSSINKMLYQQSVQKKEKNIMKNFIEKHPFWFSLGFTVIVMQVLGIVTVVIGRVLGLPDLVLRIAAAGVTTIVPLIFIWRIGWWEDSGLVSTTQNLYALAVPLILMFFPLVFYGTIQLNAQTSTFYLLAVLFTGISEEVVYRGLFMRAFLPRGKWQALLLPAVLFASAHIVQSLGGGMSLGENLAQIANAFISGLLLGAVRLRVNNIWPLIIIHAVRDLFWLTGGLWDGVINLTTYQTTVAPLFVWLPSIVAAVYLMRKPIAATINGKPVGSMDKPLAAATVGRQPAD